MAALERVVSSVGRAAALQAVGHRFDPCTTHQLFYNCYKIDWLLLRCFVVYAAR